jgi:hypothetical protein
MSAGKGDKQRPTDLVKYRENYDLVFSKPSQFDLRNMGGKITPCQSSPILPKPRTHKHLP